MKLSLQGILIAVLIVCLLLPVLACDDTEQQQPEPIIEEYGKTGTESAVSYKNNGMAAMAKGESGTARTAFTKAVSLDPNLAEAYCYRAINDMESGAPYWGGTTWDGVIADCKKAIELKADYAKAYDARGFYYVKMGQFELAVSDYSKSIELDTGDALVYYHRGFAYYQRKQWDRALTDFSKSIELDPKAIHCQYYRGTIYALGEEWDLAIDDLSKVTAQASIAWPEPRQELAQAYYQRAISYINKGDRDRAMADLNKVIELSADVDLKAQAKQKLQEMGIQ